jgi:uroporphyrin-III C-methyltransferase/precorrin-2 dehydrogenase/sirohydrochlorin ferrochelatase
MRSQRVVVGTLETLPGLASSAALRPPTLIIVGEVVRLRERLAWFDPEESAAAPADQTKLMSAAG